MDTRSSATLVETDRVRDSRKADLMATMLGYVVRYQWGYFAEVVPGDSNSATRIVVCFEVFGGPTDDPYKAGRDSLSAFTAGRELEITPIYLGLGEPIENMRQIEQMMAKE